MSKIRHKNSVAVFLYVKKYSYISSLALLSKEFYV